MIRWTAGGAVLTLGLLGAATGAAGVLPLPPPGAAPDRGRDFAIPITGATVSQGFGCTALAFEPPNPACASGHWHSGLDLAAPAGTPVRATRSGVATVTSSDRGYGLHVTLDHGGGLSSLYAHLSSVSVTSGTQVSSGQIIGTVGSTGNSTGPHLHFEIRRDQIPEDPALDLSIR